MECNETVRQRYVFYTIHDTIFTHDIIFTFIILHLN